MLGPGRDASAKNYWRGTTQDNTTAGPGKPPSTEVKWGMKRQASRQAKDLASGHTDIGAGIKADIKQISMHRADITARAGIEAGIGAGDTVVGRQASVDAMTSTSLRMVVSFGASSSLEHPRLKLWHTDKMMGHRPYDAALLLSSMEPR